MYVLFICFEIDGQVWAAIFFLAVFISFIVMSGLTFNAYRQTYYFQGLGIYGTNPNAFTLNTNTIILFIFILAASFILSHIYFLLVRWITKVPSLCLLLSLRIPLSRVL